MYEYRAFVKSVYDGDTITVDIDLGFGVWLKDQKLRLYGIQAPEVRGDGKEAGLVSKLFVKDLVEDKMVLIKTIKDAKEKFGRWLAIVFVETMESQSLNVNEELINKGLAKKYIL